MTVRDGDASSNVISLIGLIPGPGETGNGANGYGGDDTIHGSSYNDLITGGTGNDILYGNNGNDLLVGNQNNDQLYGGTGNDSLYGGAGADSLFGDAGNDVMWGGEGNDIYYHALNGGVDIINDNKNEAGGVGGGGNDTIHFTNVTQANMGYFRSGDNLVLTSLADLSDGWVDDGVVIEGFYLAGNNLVETLKTSDGLSFNLSTLV